MSIAKLSPKFFLGAEIPNVKVLSSKIDEMIEMLNTLESLALTIDQKAAIDAAASPDGSNPFATIADV